MPLDNSDLRCLEQIRDAVERIALALEKKHD